jgi:DNA-binding response OmpR family regulator
MSPHTVLVVEDDVDLRRLYGNALTFAGFDVREAGDGLDALHRLDSDRPYAIVLDLMLPRIDGFAVVHQLAAQALTRHIPVVVVTGAAWNLDYLDVACVLRKPVSPDELIDAVRRCRGGGARPADS